MLRAARALLPLLVCALTAVSQQQAPQQGPPLDATTAQALERLTELLVQKRAEREAAQQAGDQQRAAALDAEVRELSWQFGGLASRLDVKQFEAPLQRTFDLQAEVIDLARPLIQALKDVTAGPRAVTGLTDRIAALKARQDTAEAAVRAVEHTRDALPAGSPARAEAERELAGRWRPMLVTMRGEILMLQAQLARSQEEQSSTNSLVKSGVSLLLAALVFVVVLLTLRWIQNRLMRYHAAEKGSSLRLLELSLSTLTMLLTVGATLVVPYVREDWLLFGIGIVFLVGVGWVLVRMLPQYFEQIRLVLNIGAVREGERIVLDGLPFRVDELRFYSQLSNPDLQGADLRVPIQDLIGKRSRRSAPDEPWFPCRAGEVVMLTDGVVGAVQAQSPAGVVVDDYGAPRSYTIERFLVLQPRNLSRGFVLASKFGVDYRHQQDATTSIPQQLAEALRRGLGLMVPADQLLRVDVQFAAAGRNSLEYEALATFAGAAAGRYLDLKRAMQRLLVEACGQHGWNIPLPQLVVQRTGA
jgi:hypothetical protein